MLWAETCLFRLGRRRRKRSISVFLSASFIAKCSSLLPPSSSLPIQKRRSLFLFSRYDAQQCCKKKGGQRQDGVAPKKKFSCTRTLCCFGGRKSGGRWINLVFSSPSMGQKSEQGRKGEKEGGARFSLAPSFHVFPELLLSLFSSFFLFPYFFGRGKKRKEKQHCHSTVQ